jgi:hypothetical protein
MIQNVDVAPFYIHKKTRQGCETKMNFKRNFIHYSDRNNLHQ